MLYWKLRRATQRSNQWISSKQTQPFVWENHRFIHQVKMMTWHGIQHPTLPHSFVSMISRVLAPIRNLSQSGETHWQWMTQNHPKENPRGSNFSKSTQLMMPYSNKWCYSCLLMSEFSCSGSCKKKAAEEFTLYISECEVVKWGGQYWILHN